MRIGQFLGKCGPGGAETMAFNLSRQLTAEANNEVVIIVTDIADHDWVNDRLEHLDDVTIAVLPQEVMKYWSIGKLPLFIRAFARYLRTLNIDVLHSHMYPQIVRAAIAAKIAGIPHVGTLHDSYSVVEKPSRIRWLKIAAMTGTKLVAVSGEMVDTYNALCKQQMKMSLHPTVIWNGVDTDIYFPHSTEPNDVFTMIMVGRLVPIKNHSRLINAAVRLKQMDAEVKIQIVGDGPERDKIQEAIDRYDLHDMVEMLGTRKDIPDLLAAADAFILTSDSEGLSCSILEAMACGLPIIASNVGGNSELVTSGRNGQLFFIGSVNDMMRAIRDVMMDVDTFGINSLKRVHDDFTIEVMTDRYMTLYQRLTDDAKSV